MKSAPATPITLYRHPLSGHAHRAQLFLGLTGLPHTLVDVDLMKAAHKQPDFLRMNPFGQVPVIDDNGTIVYDSNAILVYLASQYEAASAWLPREPSQAARVQGWLSVAAGQIAFGPAAARLITVFGAKYSADEVIARAHALLKVMDGELSQRDFLIGAKPSIADVAAYSYIARAPEGNVSLKDYPHVMAWLARIEALPGYVPMQISHVGLLA